MAIDRDKFFSSVRSSLFNGSLSQSQVDGMNHLLDVWEQYFEVQNPRDGNKWLAYAMATTLHETASAMQPVRENNGKPYGNPVPKYWTATGPYNQIYYGRGHVQLTWDYNYQKGETRLSTVYSVAQPIYQNADLMLDPNTSALILYDGMSSGWFTGVGLPKYFNSTVEDPVNARRIVNGTDQASLIAGYYTKFKAAIAQAPAPAPVPTPPAPTPPAPPAPEPAPPIAAATITITIDSDQPVHFTINAGPNVTWSTGSPAAIS